MAITVMDPFIQVLIKKLGLPKQTFGFTLDVNMDDVVTVSCKYYPDPLQLDKNQELVFEESQFELTPIIKNEIVDITTFDHIEEGHRHFESKSNIMVKRTPNDPTR